MAYKAASSLLLLVLMSCFPASGDTGLTIKTQLVDATYCLERGGAITLRLNLEATYQNTSAETILVSQFARVSGYSLFRTEAEFRGNRPEDRVTYRHEPILDTSKLDPSAPTPRYFASLLPGASLQRMQQVGIFLSHRPRGLSLLGKDYYLVVDITHWPDKVEPGRRLRDRWKQQGLLWIGTTPTLPVKLRIDREPQAKTCRGRVD